VKHGAGGTIVRNIFQNIARPPDKVADRVIQSRRDISRRALEGAARIAVDDHQIPLVRFEPRPLLGAIGQFLAVWAEGGRAVGRRVVFGQALPIFRAAAVPLTPPPLPRGEREG
jgi:hypothetical protein